jgi:hypothetical protein
VFLPYKLADERIALTLIIHQKPTNIAIEEIHLSIITMYEPQPSSLLLSQAYESRLAIYSHIDLPPFDGHKEYAGLFLACHQLKHELEHEARLRLKAYLAKVERKVAAEYQKQGGIELVADAVALQTILSPTGCPEPTVTVPFFLPHPDHDWQKFFYPNHSGRCSYMAVYYPSEGPHSVQEKEYKQKVEKALAPLREMFGLDFSRFMLHIALPDGVKEQTSGREHGIPSTLRAKNTGKDIGKCAIGSPAKRLAILHQLSDARRNELVVLCQRTNSYDNHDRHLGFCVAENLGGAVDIPHAAESRPGASTRHSRPYDLYERSNARASGIDFQPRKRP